MHILGNIWNQISIKTNQGHHIKNVHCPPWKRYVPRRRLGTTCSIPSEAEFDSYPRVARTQSDSNRTRHFPRVATRVTSYLIHVISGEGLDCNPRMSRGLNATRHVTSRAKDGGLRTKIKNRVNLLPVLSYWGIFRLCMNRLLCRRSVIELHSYNPTIWARNSWQKWHNRAAWI
jgi:hypothetical protein